MTGPAQLPRGRHGLSREEVVGSQRRRLLDAMARAVAERGYAHVTVADVIRRAGVSRETFYEQFADKEECFIAALDAVTDIFLGRLAATQEHAGDPLERLDAMVGAYLEQLASEPELARTFLIEVYAAGPEALRERVDVMGRFSDAVCDILDARAADERFACEGLVAAISSLVTMRLAAGEAATLPKLRAPIARLARRMLGAPVGR
jgi:AcrR family transcriptional regulator